MPKNEKLRAEIVQLHCNVLVAGHGERWKIMELVTRNYWWQEVTGNMEGCNMYQRIKNQTKIPVEKLKLSKVSKKLQTYLTINSITKLLLVAEKDTILVVCNRLFKMTYFVIMTEETSAEGLTRLFRDNVWKLYCQSCKYWTIFYFIFIFIFIFCLYFIQSQDGA